MNTIEEVLATIDSRNIYFVRKNEDGSLTTIFFATLFNPKNPINIKKSIFLIGEIQKDTSIIGVISNGKFTDTIDILAKIEQLKESNDFKNRIKKRFERKMTKRELRVYRK